MGGKTPDDWSPRGAARALLWWPAVAFATAAVLPDAGPLPIVVAGAALALIGALGALVSRRVRRALVAGHHAAAQAGTAVPQAGVSGALADVPAVGPRAA